MKIIFAGMAIFAAMILAGCSRNEQQEISVVKPASNTVAKQNSISFLVNGYLVQTSGWNISRFLFSNKKTVCLNITSNMHEDKRAINLNIGAAVPGTYLFTGDGSSYGHYYPDYPGNLLNAFSFVSGSITISELDTVKHVINAHFSGRVKNRQGELVEIADGKIENGMLKEGVMLY